jgi:2-octaprenyl-6-methoxyphenol hydroxylase
VKFDVVVAGGGMVGQSLGVALAQGGLSVAVVDALAPTLATDSKFDGRVSAISFASRRLFEGLGLWPALARDAAPINDILVSDGKVSEDAAPLFLHFDHAELGPEPLGHILENRRIRLALHEALARHPSLKHKAPASVSGIEIAAAEARLHLDDGSTLSARLCVAADGAGSPLREAQGIKTIGWQYAQTGLVATVSHQRPHEGVAQEYFLPSGPFAILPMASDETGNRSSLVWTERTDLAQAFLALDEQSFDAEVARRFGPYLGATKVTGARWSYPLRLQLALDYVRPRFALAGDAAHVIHPIAGQGLNLGLRDVAALAEVLIDAARRGEDIGAEDVLARYQRWRRFDNVVLAAATDMLNRLFSNDIGPLRLARDVGLSLVGALGPARRFFMRQAGGAVGELPRLLRGEPL